MRESMNEVTGMQNESTIIVHSSDKTAPELCLTAVKNPRQVKDQISDYVEQARNARRMRTTELLDGDDLENLGE